jgi:hypothetical protein
VIFNYGDLCLLPRLMLLLQGEGLKVSLPHCPPAHTTTVVTCVCLTLLLCLLSRLMLLLQGEGLKVLLPTAPQHTPFSTVVTCVCLRLLLCLLSRVVLLLQGEGLKVLLQEGAEKGSWPKDFAAKHKFSADPVIPLPDVSQVDLQPDSDEFIVIATDGLWDCMPAGEACRFARWGRRRGEGGCMHARAVASCHCNRRLVGLHACRRSPQICKVGGQGRGRRGEGVLCMHECGGYEAVMCQSSDGGSLWQ